MLGEDAVTALRSPACAAGERLSAGRRRSNPFLGRWYLAPPVSWRAGLDEWGRAEGAEPACAGEQHCDTQTSQSFCRNKVPLNVSPAGWGFVGLQLCETWPAAVLWLQQPRIPLCAPG